MTLHAQSSLVASKHYLNLQVAENMKKENEMLKKQVEELEKKSSVSVEVWRWIICVRFCFYKPITSQALRTVLQFQVSDAMEKENELLREQIAQLVPASDSGLEVQTCFESGATVELE